MLAAVKKGRPVNEAEIPPPVATGDPSAAPRPAVPARPAPPVPSPPEPTQPEVTTPPPAVPEIITPCSEEERAEQAADLSQNSQTGTFPMI